MIKFFPRAVALLVSVFFLLPSLSLADDLEGEGSIWIEPGDFRSRGGPVIHVRYGEEHTAGETIVFECEVRSVDNFGKKRLTLQIADETGRVVHEGGLELVVREGVNPCRFSWAASPLEDGTYRARFVLWRNDLLEESSSELVVRKLSANSLSSAVEEASKGVAQLKHVADLHGKDVFKSSYHRARMAIIEDYLDYILTPGVDPRYVLDVARYLARSVGAMGAQLSFGMGTPEIYGVPSSPDLASLEERDGGFYIDDEPVFLVGLRDPDGYQGIVSQAKRYGMNLAVLDISPRLSLSQEQDKRDIQKDLRSLFEKARQKNISVTLGISPHELAEWAYDKWPEIREGSHGSFAFDVLHEGARATMSRHFEMTVPFLAEEPMLNSISILRRPVFRLGGEGVRRDFIGYVRNHYEDRYTINRVWKTRYARLKDINIWDERDQATYQYDWQSFHQKLSTEFVASIYREVRLKAPGIPLQIEFRDSVFSQGDARNGVRHESLTPYGEISGTSFSVQPRSGRYALDHPWQTIMYTYLKSLAPDKPVMNLEGFASFDETRYRDYTFRYVYATMWEGVMAGLNGISARSTGIPKKTEGNGKGVFQRPECLDAFVTAGIDFQRLSHIIMAFQRAPADVAILWSDASKIYDDGDPYLPAVVRAYDGVSLSNRKVRFITEQQCAQGQLAHVRLLVIPTMLAMSDAAFHAVSEYIEGGGAVVRSSQPLPFDSWGHSRKDSLSTNFKTVFLRGNPTATEYVHAVDAMNTAGVLPPAPAAVNDFDFPLEGVKMRYARMGDEGYLYVINLRKEAVYCFLRGDAQEGRDLIGGHKARFPMWLEPLEPMIIHLKENAGASEWVKAALDGEKGSEEADMPTADVRAVIEESQ